MTSGVRMMRKRCSVCGHVVKVPEARAKSVRVCHQLERNKGGWKTGYRCPGKMRTVVRKRKADTMPPVPRGLGLGHVLTEEYQSKVVANAVATARAKAEKEYREARDKQKEWTAEAKRTANLRRKWDKEVRRLERRIAMTDEEFAAERLRLARAAQVGAVKKRLAKSAGVDLKGGKHDAQ